MSSTLSWSGLAIIGQLRDLFSSALPWYGWAVLLAVPPLILLLYFLKLRRAPVEVPSTYLWTRTIEDLHVNSIWQRLRNSLLLLLQLLLALLLLFACLQPGCEGEELIGDRFIFLLDHSASMSATDSESDDSRLEIGKREIRNMIDAMDRNASAMIISFSDESDVVQSYTKNKSLLKRKLAGIKQTQRATDMTEALTAASGLANPGRTSDRASEVDIQVADALKAKLHIFTDGGITEVPGFSLGNLEAEYHPIGANDIPHNVGITAFSISRDLDTESGAQAFIRLQNSDDQDHRVDVSLFANGELFEAEANVEVEKEKSMVMSFDLTSLLNDFEEAIEIEARIENQDEYELDNRAYGVIEPPRKVNVLVCTPANEYLELTLGTQQIKKLADVTFEPPRYLEDKKYLEALTLGAFDLIIFDGCAPEKMPNCNTLFFGVQPPSENWVLGEKQFPTTIIDTLVTHPVMNAVTMSNVLIVEATPITGPQGTISLMDSTFGSVMSISSRLGFQDLVIGFSLVDVDSEGESTVNSDWPYKLSFPLFVQNAISWLGGASKYSTNSGTQPGELITFRTRMPAETALVQSPSGARTQVKARSDKTFVFAGADQTGLYRVQDGNDDSLDQFLAVNLLDTRESNLVVRDELKIGYEEIKGRDSTVPARQEYWTWVILAALIVLLVEWYIYNRRVFI
ncbi:MAG: VWA domain-containing protein [Planctomycetota bacterium]